MSKAKSSTTGAHWGIARQCCQQSRASHSFRSAMRPAQPVRVWHAKQAAAGLSHGRHWHGGTSDDLMQAPLSLTAYRFRKWKAGGLSLPRFFLPNAKMRMHKVTTAKSVNYSKGYYISGNCTVVAYLRTGIYVWSGSNTPVMQERHICAQSKSERAASSPGVVPVGPCTCCLSFPFRRRRSS